MKSRSTDRGQGRDRQASFLFAFELIYAGVFRIQNVPQDNMHPFIMIECPRLLFPFAREIIATSVRNGGFPPLMLDPVDFVGALSPEHGRAGAAAAAAGQTELHKARAERILLRSGFHGKFVPDRRAAQRGDEGCMRGIVLR